MAVSAGTAALQVVPQLAKTFSRDLVSQMTGPATRAADRTGKETGQRFGRQMGRHLERSGDDGARRFGVRFNKRLGAGFSTSTKLASVAAGAIGGAFAAVQVAGFLKGAIDEAREAAKVGKQTAAVIKATGGAAKVSAGKVAELAESISNTVGVDDELIQSGENWLLTFKRVRDEAGRGNQIFSRATQAAVDLAASMHQGEVSASGLHSANTLLGKALNDPLKGMQALAKAGVTFTQGQKDQIKALVESGDTLKAQKIILGEVESQVAGFAKASADPWQKMGIAIANVKEDLGTLLLPAISAVADFVTTKFIPAIKGFTEKHGPAFRDVLSRIHDIAESFFKGLRDNLEPQLDRIRQAWDDNRDSLLLLVGAFKETTDASEAGADSAKSFGDAIVGILEGAGAAARFLDQLGDAINTTNEIFQTAGADIHNKFVVPVIADLSALVLKALKGNRQMIAGAATVAEALHLPMAAGLRKAERRMSAFIDSQQADIDSATAAARAYARRVPGGSESKFGQSLRAAERQMSGFRGSFNASIGAMHGKSITIPIKGTFQPPKGFSLHSIVGATGGLVTPNAIVHRANGGPIRMGTGPTADDVPAMLSKGEYVINAKATRKHRALVEAINRDGLPGLARGGDAEVGIRTPNVGRFAARIQQVVDTVGRRTAAALQRRLRVDLGGALGGLSGPGGWRWQMAVLRNRFPGLPLISGYRPGAITATGNRSYHGFGRAVDVPPRRDVFNFIRGTYGRRTKELIFSPAGNLQIHNGRNHYYTGITRANHWDHVHWAYRKGGVVADNGAVLDPGLNLLNNRTGRPEPLVPAGQGGITVNVTVNGAVGSPRDIAQMLVPEIRQGLKEAQRRSGVPAREQVR